MFVNKELTLYADDEKADAFEYFMTDNNINYLYAEINSNYNSHRYIIKDEESFNRSTEYLDENKMYYNYKDYLPEKAALADYLMLKNNLFERDGWFCRETDFGDIEICKNGYTQAIVLFNNEKEATLNTEAFIDSEANEDALCQALVENYPKVILTDKQYKNVNFDANINLPNGFSVDLTTINKLYIKLKKGIVSVDGHWYDSSEMDKTFYSFHKDDILEGAVLIASDDLVFGKDKNCLISESSEQLKSGRFDFPVTIDRIKRNIETALPYIEKALIYDLRGKKAVDVTKELTAPYIEGYYMRKYHLEYELPDKHICKCFINISADKKEDLPALEDIKGSFWMEKLTAGWIGKFELDNDLPADICSYRSKHYDSSFNNSIVFTGLYRPEAGCPKYQGPFNEVLARQIYEYNQPIDLRGISLPRFEGRLEDCIKSEETHFFEYESNIEANKRMKQIQSKSKKEASRERV